MKQQVINTLYRTPKSKLKTYLRFGGYFAYRKMLKAQEKMKLASKNLPPANSYADGLSLYFLTGKKYIHQTLFCITSLHKVSNEKFHFHLIDDGSFDQTILDQLQYQLPDATIISSVKLEENIANSFPSHLFPNLHRKRAEYPHIKKLTDIHTLQDGNPYKLVLDSDMLFWKNPTCLIQWLKNPSDAMHMVDCAEAYGYPHQFMEELAATQVAKLVNVGAIGFKSANINWEKLEIWIGLLEEKYGKSYFLEQALSAMIISKTKTTALNAIDYIVNPSIKQGQDNSGILHHYVDLAKKYYYLEAWKKIS